MKLKDLLARLSGLSEAEQEKDAVDVLHTVAPAEVFQPIFDRGHGQGMGKKAEEVTAFKSRAEAAETKVQELTTQVEAERKKHPDVAVLQQQYQADLQKKDEEHKAALNTAAAVLATERKARARSDLVRELVSVHRVDSDYAEVLASKPEIEGRIRHNDAGEAEVLQKGKEIAIVPSADKSALAMLAEELRAGVAPKFITSEASGGSGLQSDAHGGGNGAGNGAVFSKIRDREKERNKTGTRSADDHPSLTAMRRGSPSR